MSFAASTACLAATLLLGCGSSTPNASAPSGSEPAATDSSPGANAPPADARKGLASVFVVHLMSDYDAFKKYFDEGAAERAKNGVKGYLLSKIDDGRVVIHFFADDVETVDKALKSPEMVKYLDRKGAPETSLVWLTRDVVVKLPATPPTGETYSLYLKVKVTDFDAFRRAFEQRYPVYAEQGVIAEGLHQSTEKDDIAILHFMGTSKEKLEALPKRKEFGELLTLTSNPSEAKPLVGVDVARSRPE
jgi:hypothetical protein